MNNNIQISIPKPCHEDWGKMSPNEQGAHCAKCCKTVIDFTSKSPEEISSILIKKKNEKVCGRFSNEQLKEKEKSVSLQIPMFSLPKNVSLHRMFAIALFIVFGTHLFSCKPEDEKVLGEMDVIENTTIKNGNNIMMGAPRIKDTTLKSTANNVCEPQTKYKTTIITKDSIVQQTELMGDVIMEEKPETKKMDTIIAPKIKMGKVKKRYK